MKAAILYITVITLILTILPTVVTDEDESKKTNEVAHVNDQPISPPPITATVGISHNDTFKNNTLEGNYNNPTSEGMLRRSFFVALACSGIVLLYFVIKYVCNKKKKKERRYGLLTSNDIEMNDVDSDEDDRTLFDASQQQRL